jgi:hypothetical protein
MTKDELVQKVKAIVTIARGGDADASYRGYRDLFSIPTFTQLKPEEQRQALKLLVLAKRSGTPSADLIEALRSAVPALTELVSLHNDPEDYEMLGLCHLIQSNDQAASNIFRAGLQLERDRNPQSDLCGRLMTRLSAI